MGMGCFKKGRFFLFFFFFFSALLHVGTMLW